LPQIGSHQSANLRSTPTNKRTFEKSAADRYSSRITKATIEKSAANHSWNFTTSTSEIGC
jgi:hypothetical protein